MTIPPAQDPFQDPYQDPDLTPYQAPYQAPYQSTPPTQYDLAPMPQWSDKSKILAGLLQILPGFLLGLGGIGRLYAGHTGLGLIQLGVTLLGWASLWCGFLFALPFFIFAAIWLWFVIDGIVLLAGRPVDGQGRLLRS